MDGYPCLAEYSRCPPLRIAGCTSSTTLPGQEWAPSSSLRPSMCMPATLAVAFASHARSGAFRHARPNPEHVLADYSSASQDHVLGL